MQDIIFFANQHIILISIWCFLLFLMLFFLVKNVLIKSNIINNTEAIKLINRDSAVVIDTRSTEEFKKSHIANSVNLSIQNIFLGKIQELEKYKNIPIIFIIENRHEYNKCIQKLLKYNFKHIFVLKNGIYYWNLDNLPLVTIEK